MDDTFDLSGKVAAITGAPSGFGHHFAGVLAAAGAKVLLGARREEKLAERVAEINPQCDCRVREEWVRDPSFLHREFVKIANITR